MKTAKQLLGKQSEDLAARYLQKVGYKIITKNYSCRQGEIDLIAREKDVLVFVEVRSKQNQRYGLPIETIDKNKQMKIKKAAANYLHQQGKNDCYCRFDAVAVLWEDNIPQISLYRDAF